MCVLKFNTVRIMRIIIFFDIYSNISAGPNNRRIGGVGHMPHDYIYIVVY